MNNFILLLILFFTGCSHAEQKSSVSTPKSAPSIQSILKDVCMEFNTLNTKIRNGNIKQDSALVQVQELIPQIKTYYYANGGKDFPEKEWVFPVQGYTPNAIGGKNGNGYITANYNYFDGNKHGGHPAHDIFIYDSNQDCIDDKTQKAVNVLSVTGGIVIALENQWDTLSELRGGKYLWIYDPSSNSFFYYGHNNSISVQLCDIVQPGTVIATVGRTGLNAFKKRSPTHLHIMQLELNKEYFPKPSNCYQSLLTSKKQL